MAKVLVIFGTRPEAIKLAPVVDCLKARGQGLQTVVCVTAQHRQMLDQVLAIFDIEPDHDLDIMRNDQDLFDITTAALAGLRRVIAEEKPDLVLVQGDTTTAFVSGLAAFYLKIPVAHVEAGLRTRDKHQPFPEEINRHLLSVLADLHFAPTDLARDNLLAEGIDENKVWVTGNTVVDALLKVAAAQETPEKRAAFESYFLEEWDLDLGDRSGPDGRMILVTGHRRESFGKGFENICTALKDIALQRDDVTIVYPVHLNPNVRKPVNSILEGQGNVRLIEPIEYEAFVFLMNRSHLILTDSGGIQEEAPSLDKPVLVMRETTERPEGIEAGAVRLVGTGRDSIVSATLELLDNGSVYGKMSAAANPYGDGQAAGRIVDVLSGMLAGG